MSLFNVLFSLDQFQCHLHYLLHAGVGVLTEQFDHHLLRGGRGKAQHGECAHRLVAHLVVDGGLQATADGNLLGNAECNYLVAQVEDDPLGSLQADALDAFEQTLIARRSSSTAPASMAAS